MKPSMKLKKQIIENFITHITGTSRDSPVNLEEHNWEMGDTQVAETLYSELDNIISEELVDEVLNAGFYKPNTPNLTAATD